MLKNAFLLKVGYKSLLKEYFRGWESMLKGEKVCQIELKVEKVC